MKPNLKSAQIEISGDLFADCVMPAYDYYCLDCVNYAKDKATEEECIDAFTFETRYGFSATEEEIAEKTECPFCDGPNTKKRITVPMHVRIRGHNWEEFRRENSVALRRDMALHQLQNEDPYSHMRQPGEVDDLAHRLRTGGNRDKNTDKKTFDMGKK